MAFHYKLLAVAHRDARQPPIAELWDALDIKALERDQRMQDVSDTDGYRDYEAVLTLEEARAYLPLAAKDRDPVAAWLDGLPAEAQLVVQVVEEFESGMGV